MFTNNFDPVAFNFFIFDIRWYSLSYILGILFGWIYIKKIYLTDSSSEDLFDKYISYLIIGIIIGIFRNILLYLFILIITTVFIFYY